MVLIILEGNDRSGKSTLASHINEYLHNTYPQHIVETRHAGPPRCHSLDEYEIPLIEYRPAMEHHVICDRWHIGETVYPEVMNRISTMDTSVLRHIEAFLISRGAILVHVLADENILRQRFDRELAQGNTSIVSWDQLQFSRSLFARNIRKSTLPCIDVDTSSSTYDISIIRNIVDLAFYHEEQASCLNKYVTYIGVPQPRIIFYDGIRRVNTYMRTHAHTYSQLTLCNLQYYLPSCMPVRGTGLKYFFDFIYDVIGHTDIGFMNANDVDDPYNAWYDLGKPNAIGLGQYVWDTIHTWAYGAIPHPHAIRLIAGNHTKEYKDIIKKTIMYGGNNISWRP